MSNKVEMEITEEEQLMRPVCGCSCGHHKVARHHHGLNLRYNTCPGESRETNSWIKGRFSDGQRQLWRTKCNVSGKFILSTFLILLLFGVTAGQGTDRSFLQVINVVEELPAGTVIGVIGEGVTVEAPPPYRQILFTDQSGVAEDLNINENTGKISARRRLDRERRSSYSFAAVSKFNSMIVQVTIDVTDINDHSPAFPNDTLNIDLSEYTPKDTKIKLSSAVDKDVGINNTQRYDIVEGNVGNAFRVSSKRAGSNILLVDLVVNSVLDHEITPSYSLVIIAYDGGNPPRNGTLRVNINIIDVNDYIPVFVQSHYFAEVFENSTVGVSVLEVSASDQDSGQNGNIRYFINRQQSDPQEHFVIDPVSGVIRVNKPLDFETKPEYELIVIARDNGTQPQEGSAVVSIQLININEQPAQINLVFLTGNKSGHISENAAPGEYVARISVSDPDTPGQYNAHVDVSLTGGDDHFALTTRDNVVYLMVVDKPLDREQKPYYNLTITAVDAGVPPLYASLSITIWVEDVNDNSPKFNSSFYTAEIPEAAFPGVSVLQVSATDADAGDNSLITYSLLNTPDTQSDWFQIDSRTGLIITRSNVDCEVNSQPRLTVVATDNGNPPRTGNVTVIITVRDFNDNQPMFDQSYYSVTIPENTTINSCFMTVSATDPDCGVNAQVSYSIPTNLGFDVPLEFNIGNETGQLCVARALDYEEKQTYEFTVMATDRGGLNTKAMVKIQVTDVNDNRPVFYPAIYSVNVNENTPVKIPIITVQASDPDSGVFGKITYRLTSQDTEGFVINPDTGVISLNRSLGRGERVIQLGVSAVDGLGLVAPSSATVTVSVTGANYQPPEFDMTTYNFAVEEDATSGRSIGTVQASRASSGFAGMKYSIAAGDPQNFFRINEATGVLYTNRPLDHDSYPSLLLNIQANVGSPPVFGTAQVNVTIKDINDNIPEFGVPQLEIPVKEDAAVPSTVYIVHATDKDSGPNGTVRYQLTANQGNFFSINPVTGEITLAKALDYETQKEFNLVVNAHDEGTPRRDSSIDFQVTVLDVNDNDPEFSKPTYNFTVSESVAINTQFAQMNATDKDSGNNAQITYRLDPSVQSPKFGIFPVDGHLYIREPLDREMKSLYMLKIIAMDNGNPARSVTTNVRIEVLDANDNSPVFTEPSYTFYILENQTSGTTVGYVSANDRDSGEMADLRYSLATSSQHFEINHYTGEILTKKLLDREKLREADFTVHVTDRGEPPKGADCAVKVIIQDINDNAPIFERSGPYVETVDENQPKGTSVTQIVALDPDSGENGTVTYYLAKRDLSALAYFTIHPKTGWIRTEEVLDYETRNSFTLHVMASDSGNPPMVSPLLVQVEVRDDNDEAPIFTSHNVTFNVVENSPLGFIVGKVIASDRDSGENGRISYYISGGNVFSAFDVNISTGEIFTVREIDYEEASSHSLGIKAVDNNVLNPKSSTVKVIINVQDVNDNSPAFDTDPVVLQVRENLLVDSYVYKFIASDPDSGLNGQVDYSIVSQSPAGPYFRVHRNSGILSTQVVLDHEEVQVVSLVVRARDKAKDKQKRYETTVTVVIFIIDANDNWPKFEKRSDNYERRIFEDEPVGFPIMLIVANDADSNTNSSGNNQVGYTIVSGNEEERFSLNHDTGLLEISYALDRETQSVYFLNISAYDNGTPRRTTHKLVTIYVIDVNDNAPHFEKLVYRAEVAENTSPTVVTAVKATDLDEGDNGDLKYLIPQGIAEDRFTVDGKTGVIRSTGELDRENQSSYVITVYVRDGGYPAHYDTATVIVNVTDVNDHGPVFQIPTVYLTVPENAGKSVIHTMVATDADIGKNGEVTYSLLSGDVNQKFSINSQTGELSCDGLDREAVSQYNLTIQAKDGATPSKLGQCNVLVTVTDQNDNNPIFNNPSYTATIPENVEMGKMVLQITAKDADEGVNGNVTYSLGNDTEGLFRIDSVNGRITTTGTFDREKKNEYTFQVNATDGGLDGPRYGVALVNIKVSDINDNPPVFQTVPYQATVAQDHQRNQYIMTVSAEDKDEGNNGQVSYSFIPDSASQSLRYFSIERGTGVVRTTRVLDSEALGYHNLQVLAIDNGSPISLSSTGVLEITVGNTAGLSTVQFSNLTYNINLSESSTRGTVLTTVQARLTSGSGTVTYSFANGNEEGTFNIHRTSGVITVQEASHLDFESNPRVRLIVVGSANGAYGYTTVWVNLRDSNDNAPLFGQDRYTSSVWEGHPRGTYVTQVTAIDADQGANAQIRYNIIGGNTDSAFSIEPEYSGIVKTNIILDREVHPWYKLEIEAVDHGSPSLSSTCTLKISVVDVNDNTPYLPPVAPITVPEGLEVGSLIETLFASDQDLNPTLTYYFLSDGNPGNTFSIDRYSGKITLAKKLDYEKRRRYELKVRAWDSLHEDKTTVVIDVTDENDNAPQFTQQSYQVTLPERTTANKVVFTVNATDADSGANADITYSMDIAPVDGFYINSKTGAIYTNKTIAYTTDQPVIQLVVKASDSGQPPRSSVVAIRIQVTDVNNYKPQFVQTNYSAILREDEPRGTAVIQVNATDADSSRRNHNVDYKIVRGNTGGAFVINRQTGQVRLNSELDREIKGKYSLEIMAKDRGTPPKNSTTTVKIVIKDVNDRAPVFDQQSQYYRLLNESYPSNRVFLTVTARDDDIEENGHVVYDISSGDDDNVFSINNETGEIKISPHSKLDFEKNSLHKLIIQASDCKNCPEGEPRLSAFASVIVNVTDVNEFPPVFPVDRYLVSVPESQPAGKVVFQAYAFDQDGGYYGQVVYSISGDTTGFQIDPITGYVTTTEIFNYEKRTNFEFKVSASDPASRNTTVPVIVLVESVDEFAPVFDEPEYKFTVAGSAKAGDKIGFVHASDMDGGIHHRVVYYLKTEQDYFAINKSSGELYVKKTFHEDVERQKREVSALAHRVKRALQVDQIILDIIASSGQKTREVTVNVTINRTCEGCAKVDAVKAEGLNGTPLVLVIVFAIVVIILLVVIAFILLRRHYTKQPPPNDGMFEPTEIAPQRVIPQNGHPPPYSDIHRYNINNNIHLGHTTTTSDMSDHSQHSASSGHGSVEDGEEEDEEIRMINSNNVLQTSPNRGAIMPDSGIQADDNVSEPSVQNHQEYLARLGIDTSRIKVRPKPQTITQSVESMHHFSDEGGGEGDGMDFGSVNYEKMTDIETDDELAMIENSKDYGFCDSDPQHAGSLSSVINSEEEYSGSYNWDYLLDWGPQYQPLADVFAEIARLKDDSVQPKKQPVHQVAQRQTTAQLNPPVRMIPPPIITGAPPKPLSQHLMGRSAHSSPSSGKTVHSRSSAVTSSLPRSPISHESSFTSPALTPSFTPSLSPLATGSPSSYVTPPMGSGSSHHGSSGPTTPHEKGYSHRPMGITISASESEQELRI